MIEERPSGRQVSLQASRVARTIRLSAVLAMCVCANSATAFAQSFKVEWADERLTVVGTEASLADVLTEVARQTRARVVGVEKATGSVTVDIQQATLRDGFQTLLAGVSYVMSVEWPSATARANAEVSVWLEPPPTLHPCAA